MELYLAPRCGDEAWFPSLTVAEMQQLFRVPHQSEEKAAAGSESESGVWHRQEGLLGKWLDMRCARMHAKLLQVDSL